MGKAFFMEGLESACAAAENVLFPQDGIYAAESESDGGVHGCQIKRPVVVPTW